MIRSFRSHSDVKAVVEETAEHLARGGLIAYPTETVYGLGSRIREDDLASLASMTRRPNNKPFILLVTGAEMATEFGLAFNEAAELLAARFWPGPLTIVLPAEREDIPRAVCGPQDGVAVRWSSQNETDCLLRELGYPISSTSANVSGRLPLASAAKIMSEFQREVESGRLLLLDGGPVERTVSSTLVDCTKPEPQVLREGAVSRDSVFDCLSGANK